MPSFPKPKFVYNFDLEAQFQKLETHKQERKIPEKQNDKLLIAAWNVANLGLQKRWKQHNQIIAHMLDWFDIVAIQEVNNNLEGIKQIESELPTNYELVFSDKAGNNERFAFIYDGSKVDLMELIGEVAIPPKDHRHIKLPGITAKFSGFDRNPYICSFQWKNEIFILINVHSFFGSESKSDLERRALETYAISRYADLTGKSKHAFSKKIIALGDFNLPLVEKGDLIYKALLARGLELPDHSSKVYSNIANDKMYDQISFLPSLKSTIQANGVFDFDNAIFPDLWKENTSKFRSYVKYYISDHRPIWMQLKF
jgi:exonuclease III